MSTKKENWGQNKGYWGQNKGYWGQNKGYWGQNQKKSILWGQKKRPLNTEWVQNFCVQLNPCGTRLEDTFYGVNTWTQSFFIYPEKKYFLQNFIQ